jgi:HemK-related putative methylase
MGVPPQAVQSLLAAPAFGPVRIAIGRALYWRYKLFLKKRHADFVIETVRGTRLVVAPGVLNPRLMRTGEFFADQLNTATLGEDAEVLDMGTGSGICAVVAARYARRVVAVDINPAAVRCARINTLMNRVDDRVEVLQGDLFAPLAGRRFDAVLFNPPFLRGVPRDDADRAWRSTDVAERFAAQLRDHLKPTGVALVLLSSFGGIPEFVSEFRRNQFSLSVVAEREYINERLTLLRLTPESGPAGAAVDLRPQVLDA